MIEINAFTDGSSRKNGKPDCVCGWSFVADLGDTGTFIRYGHFTQNASNNVGEIMGVLYGTLLFGGHSDISLNIKSDSNYVVQSINEWQHKHRRMNFDGIKNKELLIPLYDRWNASNNLKISWVKGHAGNKGNEIADEYAGLGADKTIRTVKNDKFNIAFVDEDSICKMLKEHCPQFWK